MTDAQKAPAPSETERAVEVAAPLEWEVAFCVKSIAQEPRLISCWGDKAAIHLGLATYDRHGDSYYLALTPFGRLVARSLQEQG